jgi:hypothetical protein
MWRSVDILHCMNSATVLGALSALGSLVLPGPLPLRGTLLPQSTASTMGTYGLGTRQLPSPSRDGCWIEMAPLTGDSLHIQLRCTTPRTHHVGGFDERLPLRGRALLYETHKSGERCRITVRFTNERAVVVQEGNDEACGFGASVSVGGTYRRINSRRPPFDLLPLERQR